jgi:tetratricopeptide (TPR) repeat protein
MPARQAQIFLKMHRIITRRAVRLLALPILLIAAVSSPAWSQQKGSAAPEYKGLPLPESWQKNMRDQGDSLALFRRAVQSEQQGRYDISRSLLAQARRRFPRHTRDSNFSDAGVYYRQGQFAKALSLFQERYQNTALPRDNFERREHSETTLALAKLYGEKGDYEKSLAYWKEWQ